ncbi:MAG: hypothetical protein NTZ48_00560, partial [Candidatus Omnitrophica bacterium]|nr:hypothetical protein [Candidatus Omnitrophota bacterium]
MKIKYIKGIVLFLVGVVLLSSHPAQARRVREGEAVAVLVNRDVKIEELSVAQLEAIYRILPEGSR